MLVVLNSSSMLRTVPAPADVLCSWPQQWLSKHNAGGSLHHLEHVTENGLHAGRPPLSNETGTNVCPQSLQYFISRDALLPEVVYIFKGTQKLLAIPPLCSKTKVRDDLTRLPLWVNKQC